MRIKSLASVFLAFSLASAVGAQNIEVLPLENLAIPKSLGRVETKFTGTDTSRWIIHIQDIHAHLTAQQNIAAILDHLSEVYGVQTVAVEGGWSSSDFPKSRSLPASSRGKQALSQALLEQSFITGPTYSALFAKTPVTLVGIEDAALYEENRALYLKFLENKESTRPKIGILKHQIEAAKSNLYNPDLFEFDKQLIAFRDGKKAETFIPFLLKTAGEKEIGYDDLPQMAAFSKMMALQNSIDSKKLEEEAKRLTAAFKYAHLSFEELLKSGKVPSEKLEFYPQSKTYLELMRLQDQIPHRELFKQIDEVISRVKEKIVRTTPEKELDFRSQAFFAAEKIMTFQASPADLKIYESFRAPLTEDLTREGLLDALNLGVSFYKIAKKRDQIFFDKIVSDPNLKGNVAVVTGGFHAEGMGEKFETAGISYQVITPDLGEKPEPADEAAYHARLAENVSTQTLSEKQNRDLTPGFDAGFTQASQTYDGGERNLPKLVSTAMSYRIGEAGGGIAAPAVSFDNQSDEGLEGQLTQALQSSVKITAIISMEELSKHLADPERGALNKKTVLAFLENPKSFLIISGSAADIDSDLIGKRNLRILAKPVAAIATSEKIKVTERDAPVAVIAESFKSEDSKIIAARPYAGIFGAIRLIAEDSRFVSQEAMEKLMERAVLILQKIYQIQAVSASA